jgi:deoxyribodipyrimidine photo-lyase
MRILFWFRKDLRLEDNTGLLEAARDSQGDVVPFYVSEPELLAREDMAATRVRFALDSLADLSGAVERAGSRLALAHGLAREEVVRAARAAGADAVYWNDEYEPALQARDADVERALGEAGVQVRRFHDRLLTPPGAVATQTARPFVVFGPFRRACEALPWPLPRTEVTRLAPHDLPHRDLATMRQLGFSTEQERWPGGSAAAHARLARFLEHGLARYESARDEPALEAGSRLAADLKFGTLSVRRVATAVRDSARAEPALAASAARFLTELRWRDFYAHVLHHFPHAEHGAFRPRYDAIRWEGDPAHFDAWREGRTGYPIVDAGMRQLARIGFMHNRVRMIVASFLTKDLLLDWRLGERHFMRHLVDGDLASNNGGWQWAASTGTDSQPFFRIFNPVSQGERWDSAGNYVRRWIPELANLSAQWIHQPWLAPAAALTDAGVALDDTYSRPIVDHGVQRARALAMYRTALLADEGAVEPA